MSRVRMKRNLKSILKYFILVVITAFVTIVIFKFSSLFNRYENNETVHTEVDKQFYRNANNYNQIDWHDLEFINIEKQRTGNIFVSCMNLIL